MRYQNAMVWPFLIGVCLAFWWWVASVVCTLWRSAAPLYVPESIRSGQNTMTIPIYTESLDDVPEALREHYKKHENGYLLNAQQSGGYSVENVAGLKSALGAARAEAKDATGKLAGFVGDDGEMLDAVTAREAMAKLAALGNDADVESKVSAAVQAQVDALSKKHSQELSLRDERVAGLTSQISKHILDDALTHALIDTSEGRTQAINPKVLAASMRDRLKVQETEGKWEVHVLDEQGQRRISPASGSDAWMSVAELVDEGRNGDLKPFFRAPSVAGTGGVEGRTSDPSAAGGTTGANGLSPTERLKQFYESQG
mgnify:CR=1 FL=1